MLPAGIIVSGYFLGEERSEDREGRPQQVVGVATGITSTRVYMGQSYKADVLAFGDPVAIKCRSYAGKNGVVYVDGEIVEV